MKWAYYVRHKLRAAMALTAIMLVILLSNVLERNSFSSLDTSMTSIYNDRLKPAAYLYEISSHLYQKRLLHDDAAQHLREDLKGSLANHDQRIASLIAAYETTELTTEESRQWKNFRSNLVQYNNAEQAWLDASIQNTTEATVLRDAVEGSFDKTIGNLHALNKIQVGEGDNLQKSSHSIVSNNLLLSYLQISLLIVLSLITLVILSASDRALFAGAGKEALN